MAFAGQPRSALPVGRKAGGKDFEGDLRSQRLCFMLLALRDDLVSQLGSTTHALGAVDPDEAVSCLSRGRRRILFPSMETGTFGEGQVRLERFQSEVAATPGTPPLRPDDTAGIVRLLAAAVKLQTGIDEVGRQRQHRLREKFFPSTWSSWSNCSPIANRTWTAWSQWPSAGDAARWGVPPDSACRRKGLGLARLHRWWCAR